MTCGTCDDEDEDEEDEEEECADSTDWYNKKPSKDCSYVDKNPEDRCSLEDDRTGRTAEVACPVTCGTCDDEDEDEDEEEECADSTTWYRKTPSKDCSYVEKNPEDRCSLEDARDGLTAEVACPVACGTCDDEEDLPVPEPTKAPVPVPTVTPTLSFLEITSIGVGSTCVSNVECEILWVYRGDSKICTELEVKVEDVNGNLIGTETVANDGEQTRTVSGDADINYYTLTLTCSDDASLTDFIEFEVSYSPAPVPLPTLKPSALPLPAPTFSAEYCEQSLEALAEECGKIIVWAPTDAPSLTPTSSRAPTAGVSSACFLDGGDCASCCAMCTEVDADSTDNRDASGCVCLAALGTDLPFSDGNSALTIYGSDYDVPPPASVGSFFPRPVRP